MRPRQFLRRFGHQRFEEVARSPEANERLQALWHRQRGQAAAACDALLAQPPRRQRAIGQRTPERWMSRPVVEELLRRSIRAGFTDPAEAARLGDLAWELSASLVEGDALLAGGPGGLADLQALVQAHRGNARRLQRDFPEAERLLDSARQFLALGDGAPEVRARVTSLHGSLLLDTFRWDRALAVLAECERALRQLSHHRERDADLAKVLLKRANALRNLRRPERALAAQEEACRLLADLDDTRLAAAAVKNLAVCHCELGRHGEAQEVLYRFWGLFERCQDPRLLLRLSWLHGMVHHGLGKPEPAKRNYRLARDGFLELGEAYDAALVSLDLATLHLQEGQPDLAAREAAALSHRLRHLEVPREVEVALRIFSRATSRGLATVNLAFQLAGQLRARDFSSVE